MKPEIRVVTVPVLPELLALQHRLEERRAYELDALSPETRRLVIELDERVERAMTDAVLFGE